MNIFILLSPTIHTLDNWLKSTIKYRTELILSREKVIKLTVDVDPVINPSLDKSHFVKYKIISTEHIYINSLVWN